MKIDYDFNLLAAPGVYMCEMKSLNDFVSRNSLKIVDIDVDSAKSNKIEHPDKSETISKIDDSIPKNSSPSKSIESPQKVEIIAKSDENSAEPPNSITFLEHGNFAVGISGHLSDSYHGKTWSVYISGIIYRDYSKVLSDAEYLHQLFTKSDDVRTNIKTVALSNGSFNAIIIKNDGSDGYFVNDVLCSRPSYFYYSATEIGSAPAPDFFRKLGLEMNFNRIALYESVRLLHTGFDRTFAKEVSRFTHGNIIYFNSVGSVKSIPTVKFEQNVDHKLTLEECAKWIDTFSTEAVKSAVTHPKLRDKPVELPLTAGFDSRQLLGILQKIGKPPGKLRHIRISEDDFKPVQAVSDGLVIPLQWENLDQLNTRDLLIRWAERSSGCINVHQYYLLQLKNHGSSQGCISFNGYLMDLLLGIAVRGKHISDKQVFENVWNRRYTGNLILKLLFRDEKRLKYETQQLFEAEFSRYVGDPRFRNIMMDLHHRSMHYIGVTDPMVSDETFMFSPGAHGDALEFVKKASHAIAGDKKAKLYILKHWYSDVAAFPFSGGLDIHKTAVSPKVVDGPVKKAFKLWLKYIRSGFKSNPAKEGEHAWLRNNKDLRHIHKRFVETSALVRDRHISGFALRFSWKLHQSGGYQGWTLMSLLSAEVAYRNLILGESPEQIVDRLFKGIENE